MKEREKRASAITAAGSIEAAIESGNLDRFVDVTVSEALVLGLLTQGVTKYIGIFGHGSTDIADVLRTYGEAGLVRTINVRHETAAAHAATALKIMTGETAAVITSIGPGAMHAFAGSLCSASNGTGVYYIFGDETTHNEGFNMQQIPRDEQGLFLKMCSIMGDSFALYEPWSIIAALRQGAVTTGGRDFGGPFFMLAPMNVQPAILEGFNLSELPAAAARVPVMAADESVFDRAVAVAREAGRVTIKLGQGSRGCGAGVMELADLLDAAIVAGPNAGGVVPASNDRYMTVGGSKGSISGNYAMNEADLVIVIGARAVCQWDSSGTAWKKAKHIINFNVNPLHASHYNRSVAIVGDAGANLERFIAALKKAGLSGSSTDSAWYQSLREKRGEWDEYRQKRYNNPVLYDEVWQKKVLTQPAAIKTVADYADSRGWMKLFDAGDVQANGFQVVDDEKEGQTFTDTGASYMGFASSGVLASALCDRYIVAFCGDGSFMMNPQILIDAVEHNATGCLVIFDNRRMSAITGLQLDQYGRQFKTSDSVVVDYVAMAASVQGVRARFGGTTVEELHHALDDAAAYDGLTVIHVPVYWGDNELGGLGVYGDWNVGNWCDRVQKEHHRIGL